MLRVPHQRRGPSRCCLLGPNAAVENSPEETLVEPAGSRTADLKLTRLGFQQPKVELERLRMHDADRLKVQVVRIQKVVRVRFDDGARDFQHGRRAALDPLVSDHLQFGRCRIRSPVLRQTPSIEPRYKGIVKRARNQNVGEQNRASPEMYQHLERGQCSALRRVHDRRSRRVPSSALDASTFTVEGIGGVPCLDDAPGCDGHLRKHAVFKTADQSFDFEGSDLALGKVERNRPAQGGLGSREPFGRGVPVALEEL